MSSKIIIITTIILLLVSFSTLFVIEAKNHNYDHEKAWSVVYFENPRNNSLDFVIENHEGEQMDYEYEIYIGDEKIAESSVEIDAGARQKVLSAIESEKLKGNKITIVIDHKDSKYRIYKEIE